MSDITDRLRRGAEHYAANNEYGHDALLTDAACEIERLRERVDELEITALGASGHLEQPEDFVENVYSPGSLLLHMRRVGRGLRQVARPSETV
ncbi:MAG: hypothetical protein AAFO79_00325 [Pseudomonadota bacterium]